MATSLKPYNYETVKPDYYFFVADSGIGYYCYFLPYGMYFENHPKIAPKVYSFNLEQTDKNAKSKGVDKRIADTVIMIVGDFLESQINAVVYVCDNSDGREKARARKFKSWFDYYEHPSSQIIQLTNNFVIGGLHIYSAMLIHRKNKLREQFAYAYFEFGDDEK